MTFELEWGHPTAWAVGAFPPVLPCECRRIARETFQEDWVGSWQSSFKPFGDFPFCSAQDQNSFPCCTGLMISPFASALHRLRLFPPSVDSTPLPCLSVPCCVKSPSDVAPWLPSCLAPSSSGSSFFQPFKALWTSVLAKCLPDTPCHTSPSRNAHNTFLTYEHLHVYL